MCPTPNSYDKVLTSSISGWDYNWRLGFQRGNEVKMRSLGQGFILYDWYPLKKRSGPRLVERGDHARTQEGGDHLQTQKRGLRGRRPSPTVILDF